MTYELDGGQRKLMQDKSDIKRFRINFDNLPAHYPTHLHRPEFWEALGRVVATFGFLEDTLRKAIFALTATRQYPETEWEAAYMKWVQTLERTLSDPLGGLIKTYEKELREHPEAPTCNREKLIEHLWEASDLRNVLCHGSWSRPDEQGRSLPRFVRKKNNEMFGTPIDLPYLGQLQQHTSELACFVMETVTLMGYQFPGSKGSGERIG